MELAEIIYIITAISTFVFGLLAKKVKYISDNLIPLQNLAIGIISAVIYYFITKDINLVLTAIPLGVGGTYDILNNLSKLRKGE